MSPTADQSDAIDAIELALADQEAIIGHPMVDDCPVDGLLASGHGLAEHRRAGP